MRRVPKTKQEEKNDIWLEEALHRVDRSFEMVQKGFIVFDKETLRGLIEEIIDDVMPSDTKNLASLSFIKRRCKRLADKEITIRG